MIRDWELIRAILVAAEAKAPTEQLQARDIEGNPELVVAHIELLHDAGYLKTTFMQTVLALCSQDRHHQSLTFCMIPDPT